MKPSPGKSRRLQLVPRLCCLLIGNEQVPARCHCCVMTRGCRPGPFPLLCCLQHCKPTRLDAVYLWLTACDWPPAHFCRGAGLFVKTTWVPGSRELKYLRGKNTGIVSWGKWDGFEYVFVFGKGVKKEQGICANYFGHLL